MATWQWVDSVNTSVVKSQCIKFFVHELTHLTIIRSLCFLLVSFSTEIFQPHQTLEHGFGHLLESRRPLMVLLSWRSIRKSQSGPKVGAVKTRAPKTIGQKNTVGHKVRECTMPWNTEFRFQASKQIRRRTVPTKRNPHRLASRSCFCHVRAG